MRQLQRMLLLLGCLFVFLYGPVYLKEQRGERIYRQWEEQQAEIFLNEAGKEGICFQKQWIVFLSGLSERQEEVRLEEYQQETDRSGAVCRVVVSWQEIREQLNLKGFYCFKKGSVLRLWVGDTLYIGHVSRKGREEW